MDAMFDRLSEIVARPAPFEQMTVADLWTDPCVSGQMLHFHLDGSVDISSHRTEFIDAATAWLGREFGLGEGKRVLDLGCGPGLYAGRFARSGAKVTGVDFSARSIAHARKAARTDGLTIEYANADYLGWEPEPDRRFDLIVLIMRDYGAMSPPQRQALLRKIERWLEPNGAFVFDIDSMAALAALAGKDESIRFERVPAGGFWSSEPYFEFVVSFVYPAEAVSLEKFTVVEAHRERTICNWIAHFDPVSLGRELGQAGLGIERLLGDVAGRPFDPDSPEFAVVVRRAVG